MAWNLGPLAPINPDGSNAPMCEAPGCYRRATKRSRDLPELTWCDDDASPLDPEIPEPTPEERLAAAKARVDKANRRAEQALERLAIRRGPIGVNPRPHGIQAPSGPLSRYTHGDPPPPPPPPPPSPIAWYESPG